MSQSSALISAIVVLDHPRKAAEKPYSTLFDGLIYAENQILVAGLSYYDSSNTSYEKPETMTYWVIASVGLRFVIL